MRSNRAAKRLLAITTVALLITSGPAFAQEADTRMPTGDRVFDAMVLRPLGAIATVAGFGFFVCSIPLAGVTQQFDVAWDTLVVNPGSYTFERTLGDF